jgi:hypothetical protein
MIGCTLLPGKTGITGRAPTRSGHSLVFGGVEQRPGGLAVYHMVAYYSNVNFGGRCL